MPKKLYYTCPLEAAYMSKNFGVRFLTYPNDEQKEEYDSDRPWDWKNGCSLDESYVEMIEDVIDYLYDASPGRIYVHPDDVGMFEFKTGDVLYNNQRDMILTWEDGDIVAKPKPSPLKGTRFEILKRDGKHFFMPQNEDDGEVDDR